MGTTNFNLSNTWTPIATGPSLDTITVAAQINDSEFIISSSTPSESLKGFKSHSASDLLDFDLNSGQTLYGRSSIQAGSQIILNNVPLFYSNQTGGLNTTSLTLRVDSDRKINICWGDGDVTEITGDDNEYTYQHNYTTQEKFGIWINGEIEYIKYLIAESQSWIEGDLANFVGFSTTLLERIRFSNTSIGGNILHLANYTGLKFFTFGNTNVVGVLYDIRYLISLQFLYLFNTPVSGDLLDLNNFPSVSTFAMYNTSCDQYTSGVLPDWTGSNIRIEDNNLSSTEVDNFIINLDAAVGIGGGTLRIDGNNAARTSASDAEYASLIAKGWTIFVN